MNTSKKQHFKKWVCTLLTCSVLGTTINPYPAQAQQLSNESTSILAESSAAEWDGVTRDKSWQTDHCLITYRLTDYWADGYTALVTVQNTSAANIENWHVSFPIHQEITDLWNARIVESTSDRTVFKNLGWNQDIAAGQSIDFGFTASGAFTGFPEICALPTTLQAVPEEDYEILYEVTDAWDTGFNGSIHILNQSDKTIEDWQLSFDLPYEIDNLWEGQIISHDNDSYLIKNNTYNQNIAAGEAVKISFTVNNGDAEVVPTAFHLQEITLGEGSSSGGEGDPDEGTHTGEDVTPGDSVSSGDPVAKDVALTIDTSSLDRNDAWELYMTEDKLENLSGTLSGIEKVEKLSYHITDLNGVVVDKGELDIQTNWKIEPIGLVLGVNSITVTALCSQGETAKSQIYLMNFNEENMDEADVDLSDTDGDGIDNYSETIFGTDPLLPDTDGDGLTDLEECIQTGTSPLAPDTDNDGTRDSHEDTDEDGLGNLAEIQAGTGTLYFDTDGDGLSDGEEVLQYLTDPLAADSDEDGLSDGEDVQLGFDPLNPDSDGNGILDGEEVLYQTCVEELDQEEAAGITQVSVSMDCAGFIDNEVHIMSVYNLDMRSTDVVGLIGAPVNIETEETFDQATITFTYDEDALGETSEDNLRIMWYDKEKDEYILLDEETVLDAENNTLSCKTDHFSTWMVVDMEVWWRVWTTNLGYENMTKSAGGMGDIVLSIETSAEISKEDLALEKVVAHEVIEKLYDANDLSILAYSDWANGCTRNIRSKEEMHEAVDKRCKNLQGERIVINGLGLGFSELICYRKSYNKTLIVCYSGEECELDSGFVFRVARYANKNNVQVHSIIFSDVVVPEFVVLAQGTGGQCYQVTTSEEALAAVSEIKDAANDRISLTDSDGEGLPDIFETCGMRLSNGTTVYTDPLKQDTDDDGISDYDEVGGFPEEVPYTINGQEYTYWVFRGALYEKLSDQFIFVDGTVNADGTVNNEKMTRVPYSDGYYKLKYEEEKIITLFDEKKTAYGAAGVHKLFEHKRESLNSELKYLAFNSALLYLIPKVSSYDKNAVGCYYTYSQATGGADAGCLIKNSDGERGTRKYIDANYMWARNLQESNSIYACFQDNFAQAKEAAESVLNEYNTEVYISTSPKCEWPGCNYVIFEEHSPENLELIAADIYKVATNMAAFGVFNSANASLTLHCTYNPESKQYKMEYIYYIVDFYDFPNLSIAYEQDLFGLARSYELFGKCPGTYTWKAGEKGLLIPTDYY